MTALEQEAKRNGWTRGEFGRIVLRFSCPDSSRKNKMLVLVAGIKKTKFQFIVGTKN
jgi:hypothetical protein